MSTPTRYNDKLALLICERIATTPQSLAKICQAPDMPSIATLFRWLRDHPDFSELYSKAKVVQAELLIDEALDLVDDSSHDLMVTHDDRLVPNLAAFKRCMIKVEYRKWLASKLLPRKYGHHHRLAISAESTRASASTTPQSSPDGGFILTEELRMELIEHRRRQMEARAAEREKAPATATTTTTARPTPNLPSPNSDLRIPTPDLPPATPAPRTPTPVPAPEPEYLQHAYTSIHPIPSHPIRHLYDISEPIRHKGMNKP